MKCPRCGGNTKKKTGAVYGQPSQKTEYEECQSCGLHSDARITGIRVTDEMPKESKVVTGA